MSQRLEGGTPHDPIRIYRGEVSTNRMAPAEQGVTIDHGTRHVEGSGNGRVREGTTGSSYQTRRLRAHRPPISSKNQSCRLTVCGQGHEARQRVKTTRPSGGEDDRITLPPTHGPVRRPINDQFRRSYSYQRLDRVTPCQNCHPPLQPGGRPPKLP